MSSDDDKDFMIQQFRNVKSLGFVRSNRAHNTGIGKTFEDYVGIVENNLDEPDLAGFEIKSYRSASQSYVTLFTKAPSFPKGANNFLKNEFGSPYKENPDLNNLHTLMFADYGNTYMQKLSFRLLDDPVAQMIFIGVFDMEGNLIDKRVGYTYQDIEKCLTKKLKSLFYVTAEVEIRNGVEYFFFNRADVYMSPSFDRFMELLRTGKIMYDIRIGSYKSGSKRGKAHDHGSGFRILEGDIRLLYDYHEIIE